MHRRTLPALGAIVAALAGPAALSAQVVELLPQLGVSTVQYESDMFDSSTGIGLEIGGKVRLGGRFYGEPGIFFSTAGADITQGTEEGSLTLGDFRVPLVIGVKVIKSRVLEFRLFGGGGVAFVSNVSGDGDLDDVTDDDIKSTLWNARIGIGGDFTLVSADVGYDFGLTDLQAEPDQGDSSVKRSGFFLEAGLRFGF